MSTHGSPHRPRRRRRLLAPLLLLLAAAAPHPPHPPAAPQAPPHATAEQAASHRRAVVLTTDVGAEMDDQWALAHLALAPEVDLRGVVTTHSPSLPSADSAARVADDVFAHLPPGVRRPPVVAGSSVPLASRREPRRGAGADFIVSEARRYAAEQRGRARPARLTVLVIGAATDVASALLVAPDVAGEIEVVAMAFDDRARGGDSWNVRNDVAAWQLLLESDVPLTVGDAAVTRRDLRMTRARARSLFGGDGRAGRYLVAELARWLDRDPAFCERITGAKDTWVVWDEVVVAHLLGVTREERRPRPALRDDLSFAADTAGSAASAKREVVWITGIQQHALWRHLAATLRRRQLGEKP